MLGCASACPPLTPVHAFFDHHTRPVNRNIIIHRAVPLCSDQIWSSACVRMECFPAPRHALPEWRATASDTILPWDCNGSFESFPSSQGLPDTMWWQDMSDEDLVSFLQSWLFFGLLSHISQAPVVIDDYVVSSDHQHRFLSLRPLCNPSVFASIGRSQRATASSKFAARTLEHLETQGRLLGWSAATTGLAIYMLLDFIRLAQEDLQFEEEGMQVGDQMWTSSFLKTNMIEAGWCPQQVKFLFQRNGPVMMVYLARLPRVNPSGITHAKCTESKCIGNNVELSGGYKCRHVDDCQCQTVLADSDMVKAIVNEGGVPLISICTETSEGPLRLKVSRATYFSRFTAISHVWADGLGNPNGNGLPECQLRRLAAQLGRVVNRNNNGRASKRSPLFWMDTLCIPVGAQDDEEVNRLKATAINSMARIYAGARQVLVLDAELQSHSVLGANAASQDETMAWIVTATWMRRCWTLHEGALGRRVWFQFADAAVHCRPHERIEALCSGKRSGIIDLSGTSFPSYVSRLSRIWPLSHTALAAEAGLREHPFKAVLRDSWRTSIYQTLELLGYGFTQRDWFGRATTEGLFALFCLVWQELVPRSTTKAEDLPTIFASLLDFKAHEILQVPAEYRMLAMLANMPVLPRELLFNRGPRLQPSSKHKNRWVPVTIGGQSIVPGKALVVSEAAPNQSILSKFLSSAESEEFATHHNGGLLRWDEKRETLSLDRDIIFVLSTLPRTVINSDFILSLPDISTASEKSNTIRYYYHVQVDRATDDDLDLDGASQVAFLISRDWQRGCILLLSHCEETREEGSFNAKGLYDCPISLKPADEPADATAILEPSMLKVSSLEIEAGKHLTTHLQHNPLTN